MLTKLARLPVALMEEYLLDDQGPDQHNRDCQCDRE
jgi:hypothetical protein